MASRTVRHGLRRSRSWLAIASVSHGPTLSRRGITWRNAVSRAGSPAPMTVRRITSSVISDIFDATGNVRPTGQPAMLSAAIWAMVEAWAATASLANGASISRRRSRCRSSSITNTEVSPSRPLSIELASPAW